MVPYLSLIYRLLELPSAYALNQHLGRPTTDRYRALIEANLQTDDIFVLDVGCGIGNFRDSFRGHYIGIDINSRYIDMARKRFPDRFEVMDCTSLGFSNDSFDEVVSVATTHHLNDDAFAKMVAEALRVVRPGGHFHVIDAVLPASKWAWFKHAWFRLDRGRYPRKLAVMLTLLRSRGRLSTHQVLKGPLHDVAYIRIARP